MGGQGSVVCIAGPAGIGKTRLADEAVAMARRRRVEVVSVFCESRTSDVPFLVAAALLRDAARTFETPRRRPPRSVPARGDGG